MKPATPILRNEHYLDVMTGGSANLPSPILREERYLAKLAGMDVSIPSPVTTKEFYYAKICGMDVDVPTYTRNMPRIYAYMAKAAGQTIEELPTAVTREQRYWYDYVSEQPVTEHEYTGAVPYTFRADGSPLVSWRISGNTVQNGTPTPDNPIMPQGTGERTAQLFSTVGTRYANTSIATGTYWQYSATTTGAVYRIPCKPNTVYTLSYIGDIDITIWRVQEINTDTVPNVSQETVNISGVYATTVPADNKTTFTTSATAKYILFQSNSTLYDSLFQSLMLVEGSTALPYEPYGYKIPISSAGQTTPVYLGEVQTTRNVKKYEFTGNEDFTNAGNSLFIFSGLFDNSPYIPQSGAYCTHYQYNSAQSDISTLIQNNEFVMPKQSGSYNVGFKDPRCSNKTEIKTFLQQQYASGAPVTVWYVLATPETAVVNEPLMKIGDYADGVSNVATISTNNGSTTIDVETAVKPSEVYIKWKGV